MLETTPGLQQILDLERIETNLFRGRTRPTDLTRVFGGEVAAQALIAAGQSVPGDRRVHSLHAYFLRPGDPAIPIVYRVDEIRDGGSFTTRRVVALQHGKAIFNLAASFQLTEEGPRHQIPQLDTSDPAELPPTGSAVDDVTRAWLADLRDRFPIDVRFPEELPRAATARGELAPPAQRMWLRSAQRLPDDPLLHVCAATYMSDLFLLASALPPHGMQIDDPDLMVASLDHAVWFHQSFRADDWMFYDQESTWAGGGRALCRGSLFDREGHLIASVMQEGLVRRLSARA